MKTNILTGGLMMMLAVSCNSFLDVVPDNRTLLDSPDAVKEILVSAYPQAHYYHICEVMSDNAQEGKVSSTHSRATLNKQMYYWDDGTETTQDNPVYVWTNYYEAIAAANMALEAIEEAGDTDEYSTAKGEALVCRAFNHFILVNLFAEHYDPNKAENMLGIPYNTKPETQAIVYYTRDNLKRVYELIEEDLTKGLPLLKDETYEVPKYHFTKAAAYAFAARFYQYKGDWDKVIEYTSNVLGANPQKKLRDLRHIKNRSDKDAYQQDYFYGEHASTLLMVSAISWWARDNYSTSLRFGMTRDIYTDLYYNKNICGTSGSSATFYVTSTYTPSDAAQMRKFKELFKYNSVGSTTGKGYAVGCLLSTEEALLNRAEAYIMKHEFDLALEDINLLLSERIWVNKNDVDADFTAYRVDLAKVKAFYDNNDKYLDLAPFYASEIDEDQMSLLKCVVDWRRREFMQEGLRWFDIKRFHLPVVHEFKFTGDPAITLTGDDLRRAIQIPTEAQGFGVEPNPR